MVSPAVIKLKDYYEFSLRLGEVFVFPLTSYCIYALTFITFLAEDVFPRLLQFFCGHGNAGSCLERYQATAKRMGDILNFVSVFDELKVKMIQ